MTKGWCHFIVTKYLQKAFLSRFFHNFSHIKCKIWKQYSEILWNWGAHLLYCGTSMDGCSSITYKSSLYGNICQYLHSFMGNRFIQNIKYLFCSLTNGVRKQGQFIVYCLLNVFLGFTICICKHNKRQT